MSPNPKTSAPKQHSRSERETQVNARYPNPLIADFDNLWPAAGYATRQDALRDAMRKLIEEMKNARKTKKRA